MNRFGPNVASVIRLEKDATGAVTPVVLHEKKKKKGRKSRGMLGQAERYVRQVARAQRSMADSYLSRHDRSSRKQRDGWVRDMPINLIRATQKGAKKVRVFKMVPMVF